MCLFPDTPPLQTALATREHSWFSMPSLHSGANRARRSVKDVMGLNTPLFNANGGSLFSGSVLSTHYSLFTTHSRVQQGTEGAEPGEEPVGGGDVFGDLGAQFFGAAEFFFLAKTLPEVDLDAPRCRFAQGLKNMGLDAEG